MQSLNSLLANEPNTLMYLYNKQDYTLDPSCMIIISTSVLFLLLFLVCTMNTAFLNSLLANGVNTLSAGILTITVKRKYT